MLVPSLLAATITIGSSASAAPFILGAGIHLGISTQRPIYQPEQTVHALHGMGFDSFRDDLSWRAVDQGPEDRLPDSLKALATGLERMKGSMRPLLVLGLGNPSYDGGAQPVSPEAQAAYVRFVGKAVKLTTPYRPIYELWNEWNIGTGTSSRKQGSPEDYVRLISTAYTAAKKISPEAIVLAGAAGERGGGWEWTKAAIDAGLFQYSDGISVHLYNHCARVRTASEMVGRLRELDNFIRMRRGRSMPVYVTEVGWPNYKEILGLSGRCSIGQKERAENYAQFLFWTTALPFVKGVWLYELKDSGSNPRDREHGFGLFDYDYKEKGSACAVREAWEIVRRSEFVSEKQSLKGLTEISLRRSGKIVRIFWGDSGTQVAMAVSGAARVKSLCGPEISERHAIPLSPTPLIVEQLDNRQSKIELFCGVESRGGKRRACQPNKPSAQ